MEFTININADKKCKRCKREWSTDNGLCLKCISKALKRGEFDHLIKKKGKS